MAKYRNKKNGRIATMVEEDKKYKTVLLEFEDDGEETQISTSTLKRWWEEVDEDDEEVDEDEEDLEDEDEEYSDDEDDEDSEDDEEDEQDEDEDDSDDDDEDSDEDEDSDDEDEDDEDESEDDEDEDEDEDSEDEDEDEDDDEDEQDDDDAADEEEDEEEEPAPKKGKKPAKEVKPSKKEKKAPAPRKKSEESDDVKALVEYAEECVKEQDGEIFQPQSQPRNRAFKVGGHMYARLLYSVKAVTVACREDAVSSLGIDPTKSINHMFSELYTFTKLDKTAKANIKKLLKASFDYQLKKNQGADKPAKKVKAEKAAPKTEKAPAKAGKAGKKNTKKEK